MEYYRGRWPNGEVPAGEPLWMLSEIDREADAVLRTVDIFHDGIVARNSIELEQHNGDICSSLVECSLEDAFKDAPLEEITRAELDAHWAKGTDRPFWFPS
jgi:hypothetical protein